MYIVVNVHHFEFYPKMIQWFSEKPQTCAKQVHVGAGVIYCSLSGIFFCLSSAAIFLLINEGIKSPLWSKTVSLTSWDMLIVSKIDIKKTWNENQADDTSHRTSQITRLTDEMNLMLDSVNTGFWLVRRLITWAAENQQLWSTHLCINVSIVTVQHSRV